MTSPQTSAVCLTEQVIEMRIRLVLSVLLTLIIGAPLVGYLVLRNLNLDDYKGVIAAEVKEIISRDVDLRGHISFSISLKPTVIARDITLSNASWAKDGPLLDIDQLAVTFDLFEMLLGTFDVTELIFKGGVIRLERNAVGQSNWQLDLDQEGVERTTEYLKGDFPYVQVVRLEDINVGYRDGQSNYKISGHVKTLDAVVDQNGQRLRTTFESTAKRQSISASGTLTSLRNLQRGGKSPIALSIQLDQTNLSLNGTFDSSGDASSFEGSFDAASPSLDDLAAFASQSLPDLGPLKANGKVAISRAALDFMELEASLGRSDLRGHAKIDLGPQYSIVVDLSSKNIDLTPILQDRDNKEKEPIEEGSKGKLIFSDKPLPLGSLPSMEVDTKLSIGKLTAGELTLDDLLVKIRQSGRVLKIDPFKIQYKGSTLSGRATLKAAEQPQVNFRILTQNFDLGSFLSEYKVTDLVEGEIDIGIDVQGQGGSLHALVANLDGKASFVMGKGRIASRYVDLIAADLLRSLMPWRKNANEAIVKCALGQFVISGGVAKTQSLLFDTKQMTMTGRGTINLETETVDFKLSPRPKDPTLISLATGLRVTGTLLNTKVSLDPESVLKEVAEGIGGVLLFGPAGVLIPFASLGAGHHHPCVNDLQKVFGTTIAKQLGDSKDPASPAQELDRDQDLPPLQDSAVPTTVLIPIAGDQISSSVMKQHLEDLGFSNIMEMEKQGAIFHVEADWRGKPLKLRIDGRLGKIEHSNR